MKEKGLLFSTDMARAILDGRKTCTRRLINVPSDYTWGGCVSDSTNRKEDGMCCFLPPGVRLPDTTGSTYVKPPYEIGDIIYVRETYRISESEKIIYKADCDYDGIYPVKWHPSLHMLKEYARIWLEVIGVRVQKVKDVTEDEAIKEGFENLKSFLEYMRDRYGKDIENCWCWVIDFKVIK